MRAALVRRIRRAQNEMTHSLALGSFQAFQRHFAGASLWRRLVWAVRGRIG